MKMNLDPKKLILACDEREENTQFGKSKRNLIPQICRQAKDHSKSDHGQGKSDLKK